MYKQFKKLHVYTGITWRRWLVGVDYVAPMYRPVDQWDKPGAGDKKGRVKYNPSELMFLVGPKVMTT